MVHMAVTPNLKAKVDELFLRWLSMPGTQRILRDDLNKVIEGRPISPKQQCLLSPGQGGGTRSVSPPAPSSSPTPVRSPRSPRDVRSLRKSGAKISPRSPELERHDSSKSLMKDSHSIDDKPGSIKIIPGCAARIPTFYFPYGQPPSSSSESDLTYKKIAQVFGIFDEGKVTKAQFVAVTKACNLPLYWKEPLFTAAGGNKSGFVTLSMFNVMWRRFTSTCFDDASKFVFLMSSKPSKNYLDSEDFVPLIQDIVNTHLGLAFLQDAPEFHSRYVHTVIARIFYNVNRSWTGRITIPELRRSNFLEVLSSLEDEEDINEIVDYFSYEHFYVIYCKFWELDTDHDLLIDEKDLAKHNNHALSTRMIKRLFSGSVTKGKTSLEGKMTYPEFVWFLLSEEDKKHPRSVEFWFRCMDIDGDGVLSMYELEYFYEEQAAKMEALGIEAMSFQDCLCQVLDMVKPVHEDKITLGDLRRCKMAHIFYNTFFNLDKYIEFEQRDPFATAKENNDGEATQQSDWERYAQEEYELLVAEEGANDQADGYEDDFEAEEDLLDEEIMSFKGLAGIEDSSSPWSIVSGFSDDKSINDDDKGYF